MDKSITHTLAVIIPLTSILVLLIAAFQSKSDFKERQKIFCQEAIHLSWADSEMCHRVLS